MARNQADIIATGAVALLGCLAIGANAPSPLPMVLGILLFVTPGYLLGQLILPVSVGALEKVSVMVGFAFAVPILGGLLLYAARVPLHRTAWLGLLGGVTVISDAALFIRRRYGQAPDFTWNPVWRMSRRNVVVFGGAILVAACAVGVARAGVALQSQPTFTQLWLSPETNDGHVESLGVTNDQGMVATYRLVLLTNGRVSNTWNLTLADGKTWQVRLPVSGGSNLVANLYLWPNLTHPYRHVTNGPTS